MPSDYENGAKTLPVEELIRLTLKAMAGRM